MSLKPQSTEENNKIYQYLQKYNAHKTILNFIALVSISHEISFINQNKFDRRTPSERKSTQYNYIVCNNKISRVV